MSVKTFRATPLPEKIINALIEAAVAYARMDALLGENSHIGSVLCDMLLSQDIYYADYEAQQDITDICIHLHVSSQGDMVSRNAEAFYSCIKYAQSRVQAVGVLTAEDILRIDGALKSLSVKLLAMDEQTGETEDIWPILHDLYGPKRQYHLLLETAIASYSLLALPDGHCLSLQTLSILFSSVFQNDFAFRGLPRQWIISTNPKSGIVSLGIEDALIHILSVFQMMWEYTGALVRMIRRKKEELTAILKINYHHQVDLGFDKLLSENLCIRNHDVHAKLRISPKTTIKHLKCLEENKLLNSVKRGREIFYFSTELLDLLKQMIEEPDNGTEKPQAFD